MIPPHEAPELLSNVFKFHTLQFAAREYFNVLEYVAMKPIAPGNTIVSRQQRRDFEKAEKKRIEKVKESASRYRKIVNMMSNQVTEDMSETQKAALEEVSIFFVDILEAIDIFKLRNDNRESFLKELKEITNKYKA